MSDVKICGLTEAAHVNSAVNAGAAYLGFVFFEKSPRNVSAPQAALLSRNIPAGVRRVGLFVNPDNATLEYILTTAQLDLIQLHGSESPERVMEVRTLTNLPVMKAVGISDCEDLDAIADYALVADMLLIDAKPPKDATLPGGNGLAFDWSLLAGRTWSKPWMLAGGLNPQNVQEAVRLTGAPVVDVSSGVETAPGHKDSTLIADFIHAAR